jgi:hypothetical protein
MLIISKQQFNEIQDVQRSNDSVYTRRTKKVNILDKIKAALPNIRWSRQKKMNVVLDEIIYKLTDRGYSFNGRQTLAEKAKCSLSIVDKAIAAIKDSRLFVVVYRENPESNGGKTPVVFYVNHPNFQTFKKIIPNLENEYIDQKIARSEKMFKNEVENKVENDEIPCESKGEGEDIFSTDIINLKHDLLINKKQAIKNSMNKVIKYVSHKVVDRIDNIEHLSSYIDRVIAKEERQALIEAEKAQLQHVRRQRVFKPSGIDHDFAMSLLGGNC